MSAKTFEYFGGKMDSLGYEDIKKFKCNLKTIKQTLNKYKLIKIKNKGLDRL